MQNVRLTTFGKLVVLLTVIIIITGFSLATGIGDRNNPSAMENDKTIEEIYTDKNSLENFINKYDVELQSAEALNDVKLSIYFNADLAEVNEEYFQALNIFVKLANTQKDAVIQVEGNTANPSNDINSEYDKNLSLQRAEAVANYLIKKGIPIKKLTIVANGSNNPIGDNATLDGKKLNRRTDIYFINLDKVVKE